MSDQFDEFGVTPEGISPDMIRAAAKRSAAIAADRGADVDPEPEVEVAPAVKARRQTTR